MSNDEGTIKQVFIGVLIAVLSALIIWKLGFNQQESTKQKNESSKHLNLEPSQNRVLRDTIIHVIKTETETSLAKKTEAKESETSPSWKLVGIWQADVVELNIPVRIFWNIRPNGTSTYTFITQYDKQVKNGTWKFSDGYTYEEFEDGGKGKGKLVWQDDNMFELTIIDNGIPASSGVKRLYVRR